MYIPIFFILILVYMPLFSALVDPSKRAEAAMPRSEAFSNVPTLLPVPRNPDGTLRRIGRFKGGMSRPADPETISSKDPLLVYLGPLEKKISEFWGLLRDVNAVLSSGSIVSIDIPKGEVTPVDPYSKMMHCLYQLEIHPEAQSISSDLREARLNLRSARNYFNVSDIEKIEKTAELYQKFNRNARPFNEQFYIDYQEDTILPLEVRYLSRDELFEKMINGREENRLLLIAYNYEYLTKKLELNDVNVNDPVINSILGNLRKGLISYDDALDALNREGVHHNILKLDNVDFFSSAQDTEKFYCLAKTFTSSDPLFAQLPIFRGESFDRPVTPNDVALCKQHYRDFQAEGMKRITDVEKKLSAIFAEMSTARGGE